MTRAVQNSDVERIRHAVRSAMIGEWGQSDAERALDRLALDRDGWEGLANQYRHQRDSLEENLARVQRHLQEKAGRVRSLEEQLELCEQSRNLLTTEVLGLLEQKEASDKAAASMSADVTRFGKALQRIAAAVEAWDNDETPDEDVPFEANMDFVNFCGHVARSAIASDPAMRQEGT